MGFYPPVFSFQPTWHLYPHFPLTQNNQSLRSNGGHFPTLITPVPHHILAIRVSSLLTSSSTNSLPWLPALPHSHFPGTLLSTLHHWSLQEASLVLPHWVLNCTSHLSLAPSVSRVIISGMPLRVDVSTMLLTWRTIAWSLALGSLPDDAEAT